MGNIVLRCEWDTYDYVVNGTHRIMLRMGHIGLRFEWDT